MSKATQAGLVVALFVLVGAAQAQAAAPANDNFSAATPLAVGQEIFDTNVDATAESNEPAPAPFVKSGNCTAITDGPQCASSVWFTFQPSQSGQYTVETCDLGTDMDTVLAVYTGSDIGSLALVDYNDDKCGGGSSGTFGSQVTFAATAGTVYHFDLNGFSADQGSYYIRAYAGAAQPRPEPDTHILRSVSFLSNSIGAAGAVTGPRSSASFALNSPTAGTTFQCALDKAAFRACTSPVSYDLAPGFSHAFSVRAVANGVTDPTPAIERFTVDATPPDTSLASGPTGDLNTQSAKWVASATERVNGGGFRCSIDGQTTSQCGPTFQVADLCQGPHTFRSAGFDNAANLDATPFVAQINETAGPACAAPTIGSSTLTTPSVTSATVFFPIDDKGAGGTLHLDIGPTTAYGMTVGDQKVAPSVATTAGMSFGVLEPGTLFHYKITLTTPFGSASTADQTVTTLPLSGTLPVIGNGTPSLVGHHAVSLPVTIDPAGVTTFYGVLLSDTGPTVQGSSPLIYTNKSIEGTATGPQAGTIDVVDLTPGATFHYRFEAFHTGSDANVVLGPEGTFQVPAIPRFKLRRKNVSTGKLGRHSRKLRVKVRGLPDATTIKLKLTVGKKGRAKASQRFGVGGKGHFKLKFNRKIRKALKDTDVKLAKLRVTALPPGQKSSKLVLRFKLDRKKHHKH